MMEFVSNSMEDTKNIAKEILKNISAGDIVLLSGDLGAGKTAFVKCVAEVLGGNPNDVTSPTFTIVNEYGLNPFTVYHFDLYRINSVEELYNIGIEDYFYGEGVCFVEWPERAPELFVGAHKVINIFKLGETSRKITFEEVEV